MSYLTNPAQKGSLGLMGVGSGLFVTPDGIVSTEPSGAFIATTLTSVDYTATDSDCYIGAKSSGITITFPAGIVGKQYIVKNQANSGNVTVRGSNGETLDNSASKNLGSNVSLVAVFDGTRWNLV